MRARKNTVSTQHIQEYDDEDDSEDAWKTKNVREKTRNHRSTRQRKLPKTEGVKSRNKRRGGSFKSVENGRSRPHASDLGGEHAEEDALIEEDISPSAACTDVSECTGYTTVSVNDHSNALSIQEDDPFEVYYVRLEDALVLDRRRPRWANGLTLKDKIDKFVNTGVAMTTEECDGTPNTLSICNQFELSNHEAMVADADRVHYYRAAIFWTGFNDYERNPLKTTKANIAETNCEATETTDVIWNERNNRIPGSEQSIPTRMTCANTPCSDANEASNAVNMYYCTNRRILEIGTGPMCVLAMNALNAGARYVDALEVSTSAARLAAKLMAAYGVTDKIKVFNCHSKNFFFDTASFFGMQLEDQSATREIELPSDPPYDMIISEILGDFCSQEGVADVFLDLQRRLLFNNPEYIKKVKSIPTAAATMFVPCVFPDADNVVNKATVHEQTSIFTPTHKMLQSVGLRIDNLPLCEQWHTFEELRFEEWMQPQMCQHRESLFFISSAGPMCGFIVGIDVEIRPNEHFGTRFGHCESWYTNVLLFDKEYQVYPGDLVLCRSVANLTNYITSNCLGDKIQVSRPSYSLRSYILSRIQPGTYVPEESKVFNYDGVFESRETTCPCLPECALEPVITVPVKALSELSVDVINTTCSAAEDWLQDYEWVLIGDDIYRVRLRPPVITIDYKEQTCAASTQAFSTRRKLPTDPPRRYKRVKVKV